MTTPESHANPAAPPATAPTPARPASSMHPPETAARIAEMMKKLGPAAVEGLRKQTAQ